MNNSDVYIYKTDVYIWLGESHLGFSYCPCKQSAIALSLVFPQLPCCFVEDNARNCLRKNSEALQTTKLQGMVASTQGPGVLDTKIMLLVRSGNTTRVASRSLSCAPSGYILVSAGTEFPKKDCWDLTPDGN